MNAVALLEDLARRGVKIEVSGDKLRLAPASAINSELRAILMEHKTELLATLRPEIHPDPLAGLLDTPLRNLTAPLAVESSVLGGTVFFVTSDSQAAEVRAKGGVAYTPAEIEILWQLHRALGPEVWAARLRLIHEGKRQLKGTIIPEGV